jgi:excisionase family DNA binding protein
MTEQCLWKISDVAQYLGIPLSGVYKMTGPKSAFRIPHVRIAGKLRFRKTDIDQWLAALTYSSVKILEKANAEAKRYGNGNRS